jgi:hypothetical protein
VHYHPGGAQPANILSQTLARWKGFPLSELSEGAAVMSSHTQFVPDRCRVTIRNWGKIDTRGRSRAWPKFLEKFLRVPSRPQAGNRADCRPKAARYWKHSAP